MKLLLIILIFVFSLGITARAQSLELLLKQVNQIKLLESDREDVRRILAEYNPYDDDDYHQELSNHEFEITVIYADGDCSNDPDDDDDQEIWKVKEWKVTRIEISPQVPIKLESIGINLKGFRRNPRFPDNPDSLVIFDKSRGVALKTSEDGVENIIIFPPGNRARQLCSGNTAVREFYSRDNWFPKSRPYDFVCVLVNLFANVEELNLSSAEIEATSSKLVSVTTVARDPENDVLTYNYTISSGRIKGAGAKVVWDLTGVPAGTYSISVGVDDGAGIVGKTASKTVLVK